MKNIITTLALLLIVGSAYSQLKVISSGFVGINESNPTERLTLSTSGSPANFLIRRTDSGNFMKAVGGLNGTAYFFKTENFFAITPGDDQADQTADWSNALVLYGAAATGGKAGKVGIGVQNPSEKLHVNGAVRATSFIMASDNRLKNNIKDFKYGLKEVLQMNPIQFNYNGEGGTSENESHIGIFAQELQDLVPELVKEYTHTTYNKNTLEEDEQILSEESYLAIKDNEIKYLLVNAIKQQQDMIDDQKSEIQTLKEQVSELVDLFSSIDVDEDGEIVHNISIELEYYDFAELGQNVPNPFSGVAKIDYIIPSNAESAYIQFFNQTGQSIKKYNIDHTGKGVITLTTDKIPSGQYAYRLVVNNELIDTKKMVMVK